MSDKPTWSDLNPDSDAVVKPTGESNFEIAQGMIKPPTGEWTVATVSSIVGNYCQDTNWNEIQQRIANAHNAALSDANKAWRDRHDRKIIEHDLRYEQQLAALQKKWDKLADEPLTHAIRKADAEIKQLREQLERERMCHTACGVIAMSNTREALAKNRVMNPEYLSASVQDCIKAAEREIKLRDQLAAERSVRTGMEKAMEGAAASEKQLRDQLAAEQEKVQTLVDALKGISRGSGAEAAIALAALAKVKEEK